jgi:hypothetical protein
MCPPTTQQTKVFRRLQPMYTAPHRHTHTSPVCTAAYPAPIAAAVLGECTMDGAAVHVARSPIGAASATARHSRGLIPYFGHKLTVTTD